MCLSIRWYTLYREKENVVEKVVFNSRIIKTNRLIHEKLTLLDKDRSPIGSSLKLKLGSLMVTTLVPKFETVFRQFYWKTIVSCRLRMTQSFKIRFSGEVNIILKTVKDQLTAFSTAWWKFQTTVAPAMILKLRCSIFFIIFALVSDQPTDQAINSMWKSVES